MKQAPKSRTQAEIAELVSLAKSGSDDAFSELLELYGALLETMSIRYSEGLPAEDRRDLRQESAIAFCRALDRFDPAEGVAFGYFAKVCVENRLIDCRRKLATNPSGRAVPLDVDPALPAAEDDPSRYVLERENYLALCERIREALSDYENRIWTLVISGRTPSEIAQSLGVERKSVENAIARVRRKLRKELPPR